MKSILALDLGTRTGWAASSETGEIESGTWTLATDKQMREVQKRGEARCCDPRILALRDRLEIQYRKQRFEILYFEDVQFAKSLAQAQLWSSFRAVCHLWCGRVKVVAVPVGTLKAFATGNGAADKPLMKAKAITRGLIPAGSIADDNEIDALWLLQLAIQKESK